MCLCRQYLDAASAAILTYQLGNVSTCRERRVGCLSGSRASDDMDPNKNRHRLVALVATHLIKRAPQGLVFFATLAADGKVLLDRLQTCGDGAAGQLQFGKFGHSRLALLAVDLVILSQADHPNQGIDFFFG